MRRAPGCGRLVMALLLAAVSPSLAADLPTDFSDQLVATGLSAPTSLAFLPDGRALVTEQQTGAIRMVVGGAVTGALTTVPSLNTVGLERGLLSVAVDPDWPARPYVYVHYTHTAGQIRLVRFTGVGTLTGGASTHLSLDSLHVLLAVPDLTEYHNGGSLRFGPDRMLYLSLGEDASPCGAQDITTHQGCVLRMDVRGLPGGAGGPPDPGLLAPLDNPFATDLNPLAKLKYAFGLRNPYRFQIDRKTGTLYVGDVGENLWEELDEIVAGENGGWPFREGPETTATGCAPLANPIYDPPIDSYDHSEGAVIISAGIVRRAFGSWGWPSHYEGSLFYGDFFYGWLRMLRSDGNGWSRAIEPGQSGDYWATGLNLPSDFQWGPDGHLWWLSWGDGQLRRIVYTGTIGVDPPGAPPRLVLAAKPNPTYGAVELAFDLPVAGNVRVGVYDLAGRRVAMLADAWCGAGHHALRWDGRDASGRIAPSGIYVVRLEAGGDVVTARLARLD